VLLRARVWLKRPVLWIEHERGFAHWAEEPPTRVELHQVSLFLCVCQELAAAFDIVSYELSGVHLSNLNAALGATCRAQFAEGSGFFCPNHQWDREPPKHELERDQTYDGQSEQKDPPHESTPWTWLASFDWPNSLRR
jgi:hypothetical protein